VTLKRFRNRPSIAVVAWAMGLLCLADVQECLAQARGARTESSIFGPRAGEGRRSRLNVTFTATQAVDTEIPPELAPRLARPNSLSVGGLSTLLNGGGDYAHNGRRYRLSASGSSAFRYYARVNRFNVLNHTGGLGVGFDLPSRTELNINQRVAYSPSYLYQLFPPAAAPVLGEPIDPGADYEIASSDSYMFQSQVQLTKQIATATRLGASAGYERTNFHGLLAERNGRLKLDSYRLETNLSHPLNRNFGLIFGYQYRNGDFGFGATQEHRASFGVQYSRALSRSRRFAVTGQIEPSTLEGPVSLRPGLPVNVPPSELNTITPGRHFRMQGRVSVEYPFRYNWALTGTVQRGIDYLAVLSEPLLSNAGRVGIKGLLTQRMDISASAAFVDGQSPLQRSRQLNSRTGNVRLRYAVSQHLAVFSEYLYYGYDLRGEPGLIEEVLPPVISQHGFRAGVMLWASPF
jgi:hypothetical protein